MSIFKSLRYFHYLAATLLRTEINSGSNCYGAHIPCFFYCTEHYLVIAIRISKQFVMIQFDDEWNFMGVFPCYGA